MEKEENVYGETTLTEDAKTLKKDGGENAAVQEASAVLGKFKNVDALAQAYNALQAEFTRRSQRLKVLEREVENFKTEKPNRGADMLGVEKLRKTAKAKREENKRFDEFLADVVAEKSAVKPTSNVTGEAVAIFNSEEEITPKKEVVPEEVPENEQSQDGLTEEAVVSEKVPMMKEEGNQEKADVESGVSAELGREKQPVAVDQPILSSEGLYEKVQKDEQVRLRIIGEYLASIGKSGAPVTCGNNGILAAPPLRAKSIADAGGMALHYFKNQNSVK